MDFSRACRRLVLLGCSSFALSGCSWIFVQGPPADYAESPRVSCTSGQAAPVIDTVVAAFQVVRTGYAISQDESDYRDFPISRGADIGFGVGLTALFTASAIYGFSATSACRTAEQTVQTAPVLQTPTGPSTVPPATSAGGALPAGAAPTELPGAPTVPSSERPASGCSFDAQCSADDVCHEGRCKPPSGAAPKDTEAR